MKMSLFIFLAALGVAGAAAAQNTAGGPVGTATYTVDFALAASVTGHPYSATATTNSSQTLIDGTHIQRQSQTLLYRDNDGRTRTENGNQIQIVDPVAKVRYTLNVQRQTYTTSPDMASVRVVPKTVVEAQISSGLAGALGGATPMLNGQPVTFTVADGRGGRGGGGGTSEGLGTQVIEGVNVVGTRRTTTIATGAIGNDRPIQIVNDTWYSPDLQINVMTKSTDPRSGETDYTLSNISLANPDLTLFQVPAGYTLAPAGGGRGGRGGGQ